MLKGECLDLSWVRRPVDLVLKVVLFSKQFHHFRVQNARFCRFRKKLRQCGRLDRSNFKSCKVRRANPMTVGSDSLDFVKTLLVKKCGFKAELFEPNFFCPDGKPLNWVGFAHRPLDARSACVAAFQSTSIDVREEVLRRRICGAPVVFVDRGSQVEIWRPGKASAECVGSPMTRDQLPPFFEEHKHNLSPRRLYEAKARGRLPDGSRQLLLFVDPGVIMYAEETLGNQLTEAVVNAVRLLQGKSVSGKRRDWCHSATFRLLATKILKDKRVLGFKSADLSDVDQSLKRIEKHYGTKFPLTVKDSDRERLIETVQLFNQLGDLRNLTTEALADVYENALTTEETRSIHGTHKTPAYLVDYIVGQLADWIAEIPIEELRIFEPACGHAPFLVSAMRLLHSLEIKPEGGLSKFLRERLLGIETDSFALEIARLSLTVADEPNSNGWNGLVEADMYAENRLANLAKRATVLLANPPYKDAQATRLLAETLPHLQPGSVFGFVIPASFLFTPDKKQPKELRAWLVDNCQLGEIDLFPDQIFNFADQECTVILGRRLPAKSRRAAPRTRLRRVREPDRDRFRNDYQFTTTRVVSQSSFRDEPDGQLWVPEFTDEVWTWLKHLPKLESIAYVGKGMEHKGQKAMPVGTKTVETQPFAGSVEGFGSVDGNWLIHEHPIIGHFNLTPNVIGQLRASAKPAPQILLNYAPVSRDHWKLKPFIDDIGRPFSSRLICVRPLTSSTPLELLWAVCSSPLAQFFVYAQMLKREVRVGAFRMLPIPVFDDLRIRNVVQLAKEYFTLVRRGPKTLLDKDGYTESALRKSLLRLDAEVLRFYALPAHAERFLLDKFAGEKRPGVPVTFDRYYPDEFTAEVPLYAYLSRSFQRHLRGDSHLLTDEEESRYDLLVAKRDSGKLSLKETRDLHDLQAEADGRDYAVSKPVLRVGVAKTEPTDAALRSLNDRLASLQLLSERKK